MRNFKDESFIAQYLSPRLIREFKLFSVLDDDSREQLEISAIHDEKGYHNIRQSLAEQYNLGSREPDIQIYNVNRRGDRSLTLRHTQYHRRPLAESSDEIVKHITRLWGFTVRLESALENDKVERTQECSV
jgi:spore cortex formation protein SpoVR/YcgB (stage V sporulation)